MSDVLRTLLSACRSALGRFGLLGSQRRSPDDRLPASAPRGRLFRKYVLLIVGLVSLVLLLNSALDFWFSYEENKTALFRIQQEKAGSAARRIEQFIDEIERQLGWTTAPQWAASPLEQRRFDYVRLLRQVPAITELIQLDDSGKEQLKVSRLAMDVVGSEKDYSQSPSFVEARQHQVWFSPVYFRKESEPYMTVALARAGRNAGVTVAEVNLKLIWDVITGLKIGQSGYAYVVDRDGRLIAHPDISLVLRNTDLANLPQVAAAHTEVPSPPSPASGVGLGWERPTDQAVMVAKGIDTRPVLTAHAAIAPLGWTVFVELPLNEALASLYGSMLRTGALLALALVLATLAALLLARRMTVPIRQLQAGAARIGAGELDRHIAIHTGDELEDLAGDFNRMAGDLQKSYADLEKKVEDRTAELTEALDQQTATAEVLQVINSSPGELAPVFEAILDKAHGLCGIALGELELYEDGKFCAVAMRGVSGRLAELLRQPFVPPSNSPLARLLAGELIVQITDLSELARQQPENLRAQAGAECGLRTVLFVPLRKDGVLLGAILAYRREGRPFSDKQIALLQNFAAQAVIAMENARLITETREALEQQTATAEVLQVINSSPGDLAPVFQSIVEKAHTLCGAACGSLQLWDGEKFRGVAMRGFSEAMVEQLRLGYSPSDMPCQRLVDGERVVHCVDLAEIDSPVAREGGVKLGGVRTILYVALRKDDVLLGQIVAARQEVRPFSEKEIALVENFAAQAVIAMENARLITETREALEQQTATAEVLQVINSSPGDLAPVFDAMLEKAHTLCGAAHGSLQLYDGEKLHAVATHAVSDKFADILREGYRAADSPASQALIEGKPFAHIADCAEIDHPVFRSAAEFAGIHTVLFVPLRKDGAFLGLISAARLEVRPFSEKEIALLENFAAQAVIAMENARLITETREALEQQTATAEVLQVINSSPGNLAPVFDAILEKAHSLCGVTIGALEIWDSARLRGLATRGLPREFDDLIRQGYEPEPNDPHWALVNGDRFVHVPNLAAIDDPTSRTAAALVGTGTFLAVALRKDDTLLGRIVAARQEVRPFAEKEIALLENFAAQAVIAMENARLITETREALEQQTATAEVLRVINSSPGDLAPVFDAMLEKATRLCEAPRGQLATFDGEFFRFVAVHGEAGFTEGQFAQGATRPEIGVTWPRIVRGESFVHMVDVMDSELYRAGHEGARRFVDVGGGRSLLTVALRKDEVLLGALTIYRQEVLPFNDKQIALLQNFAAQAVIAMENARLITETREALEQQTATAEVLGVINSSPGDLTPVFDAMLERAMRLCGGSFGVFATYEGEHYRVAATRGLPPGLAEFVRDPIAIQPGSMPERLRRGEDTIQIPDIDALGSEHRTPGLVAMIELGKARTAVWVALRKDGVAQGFFGVYRQEVRPFSDKQIALLQNFAAQAVIAMENARLITETREALEQQTATAEVLQVINSSPSDLTPVFSAILEKAHSLCGVTFGSLQLYDGQKLRAVAMRGFPEPLEKVIREPYAPDLNSPLLGLIGGGRFVQIPDLAERDTRAPNPRSRVAVDLGIRTLLFLPLRKDNLLLGLISVARKEAKLFSEREIALLENFAAQAVIAMENARLITETREALEQQTATAEVLQVINSSPGDLAPVFEAMLDKAIRLCEATHGHLFTYDGECFRPAAVSGERPFVEWARRVGAVRPAPSASLGRISHGQPIVHIADVREEEVYRTVPNFREQADIRGVRSQITVGLLKDNTLLGAMVVYRQEVRPFTGKQIALLQNFAAQAVIAMENARLITETHEALEQQTATAEVLQVINSSPGDLAPVFDAMLEKATRLCEAPYGTLFTYDGECFHAAATRGVPEAFADSLHVPIRPVPGAALDRMVRGERFSHFADVASENAYGQGDPAVRALVELGGARTALAVPLRKDDTLLGVFAVYRQEVRPFSEKEIALVTTFADQAVIAIENTRLLNELRQRTRDLQESLEYQTATSDVLKVISQSTFDLEPVLQTVLDTAMRLCGNSQGEIFRLEDGAYRMAVGYGMEPDYHDIEARLSIPPGPDTLVGRTALAGQSVQIIDALADPDYAPKDDAQIGRLRSMLGVPLLREGVPIGVICTARTTVEPFTEKQIALVRTFADQAVIAIENARLFNELRARTNELGSSVAELKMLSEVGQAVSSTLDLRTVLSTILNASLGVTWANAGAVFRYSRAERAFRLVEAVGWDEALAHSVRELHVAETESAMGEAVARRMPIQLADLAQRASYPLRDVTLAAGFHSALIVPLVGAERILGAIILMRQEAGEFPAETVRLMQTLASQSVLAIQNARLFREIADKSEQLALASQHKSQFLANMSHELRTPLNAILGYAELLVDGIYGVLPERPRGVLDRIHNNGKHLLALINDVLDLAKIEAGQLTLTLEDYSVPEVVKSVVIATEPLATSKGLKFTAAVQDDLPIAHGDARRVSQVLLNLVGNAIKFTDKGKVEIGASLDKGQFVLTVRDTGPGIPDADQERIFGEFQQIDNSNTRKKGGTGLGLAISKRMVEMQGGTISVDSVLGQGSTFRVVLPVHVDEMMEAA